MESDAYILFHVLIIGENWRLFKEKHLLLNVVLNKKKTSRFFHSVGTKNRVLPIVYIFIVLDRIWPRLNGLHRVKTK